MGSINQARLEGFICRLCSLLSRDKEIIHIYSEEGISKNLEHKINIYLQINLSKFDPLPKTICESCDSKLHQHHLFMQRVIDNQKKIEQRNQFLDNRSREVLRSMSNPQTVPSTSSQTGTSNNSNNSNAQISNEDSSDDSDLDEEFDSDQDIEITSLSGLEDDTSDNNSEIVDNEFEEGDTENPSNVDTNPGR